MSPKIWIKSCKTYISRYFLPLNGFNELGFFWGVGGGGEGVGRGGGSREGVGVMGYVCGVVIASIYLPSF